MTQAITEQAQHQQGEHTRPAVDRIADFAVAARPVQLTSEIRHLFKRNILDSLGCAIAALPGQPFQALREQFEEYRAPGRSTLIGGGCLDEFGEGIAVDALKLRVAQALFNRASPPHP